jgi:uncharacterized membrane protein YeaQ/YmgE (transglycosylase-associated protein family)
LASAPERRGTIGARYDRTVRASRVSIFPLENTMILGILGWLAVALLVGFVASRIVDLHGDDPRLGFAAACGGAIVAAALYTLISQAGVSAWNPWSLLFAAIGAAVGVVTWHLVRSRSVSRESYTRRSSYSTTGR